MDYEQPCWPWHLADYAQSMLYKSAKVFFVMIRYLPLYRSNDQGTRELNHRFYCLRLLLWYEVQILSQLQAQLFLLDHYLETNPSLKKQFECQLRWGPIIEYLSSDWLRDYLTNFVLQCHYVLRGHFTRLETNPTEHPTYTSCKVLGFKFHLMMVSTLPLIRHFRFLIGQPDCAIEKEICQVFKTNRNTYSNALRSHYEFSKLPVLSWTIVSGQLPMCISSKVHCLGLFIEKEFIGPERQLWPLSHPELINRRILRTLVHEHIKTGFLHVELVSMSSLTDNDKCSINEFFKGKITIFVIIHNAILAFVQARDRLRHYQMTNSAFEKGHDERIALFDQCFDGLDGIVKTLKEFMPAYLHQWAYAWEPQSLETRIANLRNSLVAVTNQVTMMVKQVLIPCKICDLLGSVSVVKKIPCRLCASVGCIEDCFNCFLRRKGPNGHNLMHLSHSLPVVASHHDYYHKYLRDVI